MKKKLSLAAVALLVVAVVIVIFTFAGKQKTVEPSSSTPTPEATTAPTPTAEPTAPPTPIPTPEAPKELCVVDEQGNIIEAPDIDQTGGWVAQYTSIDTNKQSLIKLVRTTLYGMNYVFTETLKDVEDASFEDGTLGNLLRCLKDGATENDKLAEKWEGKSGKRVGVNLPSPYDTWTVGDWAAATGNWFFMNGPLTFKECPKDKDVPYLKQCILNQVFLADVNNDLDDWNLQGVIDKVYGGYDINYALDFTWNDAEYRALIGNRNMEYVVLDVVPRDYVYGDAITDNPNPIPATIPVEAKSPSNSGGNSATGSGNQNGNQQGTSSIPVTSSAPAAVYQPPAVIPNNTVPPDNEEPKALTLDELKAMGILPEDYELPDNHGVTEFHIDWENQIDIDDMKSWDD